jgi:glutamate synthase (NADPH/NADH) small chain
MVDGMGMCGACRVSVDGKTRFACVESPEFDAHKVDFGELLKRQMAYVSEEELALQRWQNRGALPMSETKSKPKLQKTSVVIPKQKADMRKHNFMEVVLGYTGRASLAGS